MKTCLVLVCLIGLVLVSQARPEKSKIQQVKMNAQQNTLDNLRDEKREVRNILQE